MGGAPGRKRISEEEATNCSANQTKRARREEKETPTVKNPLLDQYFPKVQTLRQYLVSQLPGSSRLRRKKIANVGSSPNDDLDRTLSPLLDTTLVGVSDSIRTPQDDGRYSEWISYSQLGEDSHVTLSDGLSPALFSQSEIVDFVVWLLFKRKSASSQWPKHILGNGFRSGAPRNGHTATTSIPGLFSVYPNRHVEALKAAPWPQLLMLLGKSGEKIMMNLLLDCAIFLPVRAGMGNLYQLSGIPLSEMDVNVAKKPRQNDDSAKRSSDESSGVALDRAPSTINFVRSRMLYARPALNARGMVQFGLRHIHVLNRCPAPASAAPGQETDHAAEFQGHDKTVKVMMYIFPRQFGLHNVFTSVVDRTITTHPFQDYTLREEEIASFKQTKSEAGKPEIRVPKRLHGEAMRLIRRLQVLHGRCSYSELLRHYCPTPLDSQRAKDAAASQKQSNRAPDAKPQTAGLASTQSQTSKRERRRKSSQKAPERPKGGHSIPDEPLIKFDSLVELSTPLSQVSAFCRAVVANIIPNEIWGDGAYQEHNKNLFLSRVDHFVKLRRFEAMSLREVGDGLKVTDIGWLAPSKLASQKTSQSDMRKRLEILNEFLYYVFDSILIPLIRSNFYVTESNTHRYRLFYFRHDIWRYIAEPAMAELRTKMFEEVKMGRPGQSIGDGSLGVSRVRLLPKQSTMRPIINLKRRFANSDNGQTLGRSINSLLGPVQAVLKMEKDNDPSRLAGSLFSVSDLYDRLKAFRSQLRLGPGSSKKLYFAKLDVHAAFDTIPQDGVLRVVGRIPSHLQYKLLKHVEVKAGGGGTDKPSRRWHTVAMGEEEKIPFTQRVEEQLAVKKRHTVFIDNPTRRRENTRALLSLMESHVRKNLVRIGKKYYRQKTGIPQGSVLSSTLCNYFYADLERRHLSFLAGEQSLLLRLIDDFLLITTDLAKARKFVEVMHGGLPDYGVTVSSAKTLVNFDMELDGESVPKLPTGERFPYCGTLIDCKTLDISRNRENVKDKVTANGLTVEYGRQPGQNFTRKVLNAFKIQSHNMFFDTSYNSAGTVLANLSGAFTETAAKMWAHIRCLGVKSQPTPKLLIATISKLVDVAFLLLSGKFRKLKYPGYTCAVAKVQVSWLAFHAVEKVLRRRQSRYREVVEWLTREIGRLESKKGIKDIRLLRHVV